MSNPAAKFYKISICDSDQEMFDTLAEVLRYGGRPIYAPARQGEIYRICLDSSKAQKELSWNPGLTLREGLSQTAHYYESLVGPTSR